jgi:hypothetical protein
MTTSYKIVPELNLIYYRVSGLCKASDLLQVERKAFTDPLRRPGMKIIFDTLNAEIELEVKDIFDGVALNKQLKNTGWELEKTAVLSRSRTAETISDTFQLIADGLSIKLSIFRTLPDALQWLELQEYEKEIQDIQVSLIEEVQK